MVKRGRFFFCKIKKEALPLNCKKRTVPDLPRKEKIMRVIVAAAGTAGHINPGLAIANKIKEKEPNSEIMFIGTTRGLENDLVPRAGYELKTIEAYGLSKKVSIENIKKMIKTFKGYGEAKKIIKELKPDVIFSKGGFVSVPVVIAGKQCKVPTIIHESDMTPGLANKLAIPSATKVCCNFPETLSHLPKEKAVLTGSPIRKELMLGDRKKALDFCGLTEEKPILLIMGGSQGSVIVNNAVRAILPELLKEFSIIHLCGKGKVEQSLLGQKGYVQFEYIQKELNDLFALADIILSRAGANAICEILALRKPNLLIPLSVNASRGDQILNARSFERQGFSMVLEEEEIKDTVLLDAIRKLYKEKDAYIDAMKKSSQQDSIETILELIKEASK